MPVSHPFILAFFNLILFWYWVLQGMLALRKSLCASVCHCAQCLLALLFGKVLIVTGFNFQAIGKQKTALKIPRLPNHVCFKKRRWTTYTKECGTYIHALLSGTRGKSLFSEWRKMQVQAHLKAVYQGDHVHSETSELPTAGPGPVTASFMA